jgi:hypothetical protein
MVERRLLTADFVNRATPPDLGERWIADTKLRGFGLRLWRTSSGEGKALAIRVVDTEGRSIRRTYVVKLETNTGHFTMAGEASVTHWRTREHGRPTSFVEPRVDQRSESKRMSTGKESRIGFRV